MPNVLLKLRWQGVEPKAEVVTVCVLQELLTRQAWNDEEKREEWFRFLYPTVEGQLAHSQHRFCRISRQSQCAGFNFPD